LARASVSELAAVQTECDERLQKLPESPQESSTAEALQMIYDLDLEELQEVEPPRQSIQIKSQKR
jgi:hypothetical protein